ncbi:MAG: HAD-IA family hydrolase [Acidobacteriia bacterium]|nr:HAD-IA family hydrolase [Terriglobia bacterium]
MIRKNRAIPAHQIRLLIFDLDGTLVDSRLDLSNSVNAMLRHYGKPELPCDVIASYIGNGAPMLVRRSLGDPDDESFVQEALLYFMGYYREHKLDNTYVYDGVIAALDAIRASHDGQRQAASREASRGIAGRYGLQHLASQYSLGELKMAVLSNKPVGPSKGIVDALGLGKYFFQVYGGNSFHTKKPDPAGVQALLSEAEAHEEETVIIGDSDVDMITARNAGIYSVGVTYGLAPHTLEDAPPDVLVDHPKELADVLGNREQARLEFKAE